MVNSALVPLRRALGLPAPVSPGVVRVTPRALAPALPKYRPPRSPFAVSLRDHGFMQFTGKVGQFQDQEGQSHSSVGITSHEVNAATGTTGSQTVTLSLDQEAARYLPPRTRVRVTLEVLPDEEDDD